MQAKKQQINTRLIKIQKTNQVLHELTIDLSLLDAVSAMTLGVAQSIEALLEQSESMGDEFIVLLEDSESIDILDEVVDTDAISELENQFFSVIENMEDSEMGGFLTEMIEKIELRYTHLVEAIHELNALLSTTE